MVELQAGMVVVSLVVYVVMEVVLLLLEKCLRHFVICIRSKAVYLVKVRLLLILEGLMERKFS